MKTISLCKHCAFVVMFAVILSIACPFSNSPVYAGDSETIIDLWDTAKAPAPGEVK